MRPTLEIKPETLSRWMKFIRFHPDLAERFMDCFWESQLTSKQNIISLLEDREMLGNVYIFGGWYGLLAKLIEDSDNLIANFILSIDIDPVCDWVISDLYPDSKHILPFTADMADWEYSWNIPPNTIINTITEHVNQDTYDGWWDKIPSGTFYLLQGNDFFEDPEHIRCSVDMEDFKKMNHCEDSLNEFQFKCDGPDGKQFTRFMTVGIK